jgi:anti-sigma factor RsiW
MMDASLHDRIALLLDADLDPDERHRLEDLVARDPQARRRLDEHRAVWSLLDRYAAVAAPERVRAGLTARVREERRVARRRRLLAVSVSWAAAAALFLAVFLGLPPEQARDDGYDQRAIELRETYSRYAASFYDFEDF